MLYKLESYVNCTEFQVIRGQLHPIRGLIPYYASSGQAERLDLGYPGSLSVSMLSSYWGFQFSASDEQKIDLYGLFDMCS